MSETNIRYDFENDFVYFTKITSLIDSKNYLNIYCFSLLFTNDINTIQSFKDLTTLSTDENTLIADSLFPHCNTQSLPFTKFEKLTRKKRNKTKKESEDTYFKSCIYINTINLPYTKGSTKIVDSASEAFQPDLPSRMKMKDNETFYGQLN
ncbi:hypothetical protein ABK040_004871 [Willaertia magna]